MRLEDRRRPCSYVVGLVYYLFGIQRSTAFILSHTVVPVAPTRPSRTIHDDLTSTVASSTRAKVRSMIPLRQFETDITFLSAPDSYLRCLDRNGRLTNTGSSDSYELSLVEESDLFDVARFVVSVFGADVIRLSQDLGSFEKLIIAPAIELVNGYSGLVAFAEVLTGLRSRLSIRQQTRRMDLSPPDLTRLSRSDQINVAAGTSVVLALARKRSNDEKDWHSEVIASIELRLQPCDAKIPFTLPWIDRIERWLAALLGIGAEKSRDLQPYLSNLCVDENHRGKGLGKVLVRCVENIAATSWGYSRMYLHVDPDNTVAMELYKSEGYRDVGRRWRPFWAGKASDVGYYVKDLNAS